MDGMDAVGEAVTGGLLARAVEPHAGESDGHTHEKICLNCGTALIGPYCSACGQKAHVHRTVLGLMPPQAPLVSEPFTNYFCSDPDGHLVQVYFDAHAV